MAPPGFRAAPRAAFVVTTIRLQSLTPSRLWRCALRLPPGESPAGYPRRAQLGAPVRAPNRSCRIGQPMRRRDGWGAGEHAVACCGRLCECVPSSMLAVLAYHVHEGWLTDTARHRHEASYHASKQAPHSAAGAFSPVVGWLTWPASASAPMQPSCGYAEPASSPFGAVRPKASLPRCES